MTDMIQKINKEIESDKILTICTVILGFSLTLLTYFSELSGSSNTSIIIIFWLIIIPFGLEAIIVSISNIFSIKKKLIDIGLFLCFISLLVSLILLFSDKVLPKIKISEYSYLIGPIFLGLVIVSFVVMNILASVYEGSIKKFIFDKIYQIKKSLKKDEYITSIVVVSNNVLDVMVGEMCGISYRKDAVLGPRLTGYSFRSYKIKDISEKNINLIEENIILISDSDNLKDIIDVFEKNKNKIIGIIVDYKMDTKTKNSLKKYIIKDMD